jgi:phage tail-like protein
MKRGEIARLLPEVVQRTVRSGEPLAGLLEVMEGLHAPSEAALADFDAHLDPGRCPDAFVPLLARWLDLDRFLGAGSDPDAFAVGTGRLRELVAAAPALSRSRGTERGLVAFLETATGLAPFGVDDRVLDPAGRPRPFHLRVSAPAAAQHLHELVVQVIESEKPLHLTYEVVYAEA